MNATVTAAHLRLEVELQSRLGDRVVVVCCGVDGDPRILWPEERLAVASAIHRRQREFAAGRAAARAAMRRLQTSERAIPARSDRSPCWPSEVIGSISHTSDTCVVVVARRSSLRSIGIDIEPEVELDEALWDTICTPEERREIETHPPAGWALMVLRLFVAKEAFYKWWYPLQGQPLEFHEVTVKWCADRTGYSVLLDDITESAQVIRCGGHLTTFEGKVVAFCTGGGAPPSEHPG